MSKIRLGIAEDFAVIRKSLITVLQLDKQLEVVAEAENGLQLIKSIKALVQPPEVVILDINMPKMDGYDTLVELRKDYPNMRFIILSQHSHSLIVARMLIAGANAYLHKNCDPKDLRRAIRTILEQPYFQSELVKGELIKLISQEKTGKIQQLTEREIEFLKYCCSELTYKEIAGRMKIAERTTAFYRDELFSKLDVNTRTGLAIFALSIGLTAAE
jgi:DNA-binding NarL/FixJ family response regulator